MAKQTKFLLKIRTYTALLSTWILNLGMFGVKFRTICSPGFNCHGCPWATGACPIGVSAYGTAVRNVPAFALGSTLLTGALFGRHVCGYVCPFGLFQDILYRIPTKKLTLPRFTRYFKYAALALLVFIFPYLLGFKSSGYVQIQNASLERKEKGTISVAATIRNPGTEPVTSPALDVIYRAKKDGKTLEKISKSFAGTTVEPAASLALPGFTIPDRFSEATLAIESPQSVVDQSPLIDFLYYCKICPAGTLTATIPSYFTKSRTGSAGMFKGHILRLGILIFFLVLMVLVTRPFCQTFCPLGAFYALTTRFSLIRLSTDRDACIACGKCNKVCPVNLDVPREVGGPECIACSDCMKACPKLAIRRHIGY